MKPVTEGACGRCARGAPTRGPKLDGAGPGVVEGRLPLATAIAATLSTAVAVEPTVTVIATTGAAALTATSGLLRRGSGGALRRTRGGRGWVATRTDGGGATASAC